MQMLKKLFNSDKKYYLELDEIKDSEVVQTAIKTAEKAADVVKDKTAEVTQSKPVREAIDTASEAVEAAQSKLASVVTTEEKSDDIKTKANGKTKKTSIKAKSQQNSPGKVSAKSQQNGKVVEADASKSNNKQAQPSPKDSGASSFDPPFWVAAMYNNTGGVNSDGQVAEQTFASDNLMPIVTKYRRRPGGSLSKFKDMAKQAKTPKG